MAAYRQTLVKLGTLIVPAELRDESILARASVSNMEALNHSFEFKVESLRAFAAPIVGVEHLPAAWLRDTTTRVNPVVCIFRIQPAICKGNAVVGRRL
jgi:hypothetical protein